MSDDRRPELLAAGETMVMVTPEAGGGLTASGRYLLRPGGAESNVARHLAMLGHRAAWAGALGADPLGAIVTEDLRSAGVDLDSVVTDPEHPTAVYFKNPTDAGTEVFYYRSGSAAAALTRTSATAWARRRPRVLHLSGITPALSTSCRDLTDALILERAVPGATVSFDVNHRAALWDDSAPETLLQYARSSDIVFVGLDEAERLWGTQTAEAVRAVIPDAATLIVKDGVNEAIEFDHDTVSRVPARRVDVVDVVGAGDAFAAGWLSGWLSDRSAAVRLSMGHGVASRVVMSPSDAADLPTAAELADEATTLIADHTALA